MSTFIPTERTRLGRKPERAVIDKEQIYAILDEAFVCHVGFVAAGQPYVIPTAYGRSGDTLFLHGSAANRMLRSMAEGIDVCVTVTLVDGLVLGRSAFRHSINYRSVVALGRARLVTDAQEKLEALRCFTNHIVPDRWEEVRQPNQTEMVSTSVLALPLTEVSAKARTGPPADFPDDFAIPVWAGVMPVATALGEPIPAEQLPQGIAAISKSRLVRCRRD